MKRALIAVALLLVTSRARAVGEEIEGFPSWAERVEHEWTNRARVDPKLETDKCGANCPDASCYTAQPPLSWGDMLSHAARFHSSEMKARGFFAHDSNCALVSNIKDLYPATCKGEASCACVGGMVSGTTNFSTRVGLFGAGASGEIIAGGSDPDGAFYLWLYEHGTDATCSFSFDKGHRWLLLTSTGSVGFGVDGNSTGDFGGGGVDSKLASGSHYPRGGSDVDLWTNWHDTAGPKAALVNVGGTCHPMTLTRGVETNGAYLFHASGLSGCTRYYFRFKDSAGADVEWPTTGSLGIGDDSCADFSSTRPAAGAGCDCTPSCSGKVCGDDGCGGSCGACKTSETCSSGACVAKPVMDSGTPVEDSGAPPADSGPALTPDAAAPRDATPTTNDDTTGGDLEGSCGCRVPSRARLDPRMLFGLLFLLRRRPLRRRL
jgi:hypothetical protein